MKANFENNPLRVLIRDINGMPEYLPMFHPHMEIFYVTSGTTEVNVEGVRFLMKEGDILFIFPYLVHEYKFNPTVRGILIMFTPAACSKFEEILISRKPVTPYKEGGGRAHHALFSRLIELSETDSAIAMETIRSYISSIVGELLMALELTPTKAGDFNTTQKLLNYCSSHFRERITIKTVSANLFITENHITRIFSTKLGMSFRDYINKLRIDEAINCLRHSDMKITDVMYECGFTNQSTFNRVFYQMCGTTPKEYRAKHMLF